jgi:hypothetical protein
MLTLSDLDDELIGTLRRIPSFSINQDLGVHGLHPDGHGS